MLKINQPTDPRTLTAQAFINAEAIENKILWTKDKRLFAFIRVKGKDNSLLTLDEHQKLTAQLAQDLADQREPFQFISVPRTVDTDGMIHELKELRGNSSNDAQLRLLTGEIAALERMAEEGAKEPLIFLKIWQAAARNADRELLERAEKLAERLSGNQISAYIMEDEEILHLCRIYAELGVWQPEKVDTDIPLLPGIRRIFSHKPSPEEVAEAELLEQITPAGGLVFKPTSLMVGSSYCKCYGATRYPSGIDFGWAVQLMGATDCITCITYYPGNEAEIGQALSRSAKQSNQDADSHNDLRAKKRYLRKAKDADRLIDQQDGEGMALGQMSIVTMPFADSPEDLEERCKEMINRFGRKKIKLRQLAQLQKDAFKHISPYYPDQPIVNDMLMRIIPLETVVGGYPCTLNTLRDDHGVYFARTPDQSIISLDFFLRSDDRTNGNGIVTGIPGIGKSTMLKHVIESFFMQGIKIIVMDPEREFRQLCKNLGGSWWDAGGGKARVNLLQIQAPIPDDENDPKFRSDPCPLSSHIQTIQTILQFKIPSLTDNHQSLLERALRELYATFGITLEWEYDYNRKPTEYPIMKDLWELLKKKSVTEPEYKDLALLLESMAIGADSVIWNGHTNIDFSAPIVVIDTYQLHDSTEQNRAAQYYNLMRMAFTVASKDQTTPYAIVADEAQTMFDPELPAVSTAMKNIALRIRKREGCLWLAFHSLHELLDQRIRLYGQPILDAATYKILFGTDGRNLADTVDLFKLTPAEEKVLNARQRGKALALIGSQHLKVEFKIPAYKMALMGTGGGR